MLLYRMNLINILTIALGLSMDAFSVSVTEGAVVKSLKKSYVLRLTFLFGAFQTFMPLIGWWLGKLTFHYIERYNKLIALLILLFLGTKMIFDAIMDKEHDKTRSLNIKRMLLLAVATSIDALAVGFSLGSLKMPILSSVLIIGIVTFIFSLIGIYLGNFIGVFLKNKAEIFGGIVLILVGIKIFLGF